MSKQSKPIDLSGLISASQAIGQAWGSEDAEIEITRDEVIEGVAVALKPLCRTKDGKVLVPFNHFMTGIYTPVVLWHGMNYDTKLFPRGEVSDAHPKGEPCKVIPRPVPAATRNMVKTVKAKLVSKTYNFKFLEDDTPPTPEAMKKREKDAARRKETRDRVDAYAVQNGLTDNPYLACKMAISERLSESDCVDSVKDKVVVDLGRVLTLIKAEEQDSTSDIRKAMNVRMDSSAPFTRRLYALSLTVDNLGNTIETSD
jgi:hypothetical protein